jgi:phosphonate transport system permease protein
MDVTQNSMPVRAKQAANIAQEHEALLKPLPGLSIRGVLTTIVLVIVLSWSFQGAQASPAALIRGIPNIVDFVSRLFPLELDWKAVAKLPVEIPLPFTISATRYEDSLDGNAQQALIEQQIAETVPLDQLLESGQPMPEDQQVTITAAVNEDPNRPWFSFTPSVLNRIWLPGIVPAVVETLQMAIVGTLLSILLSIPFALLAARNTTPGKTIYQITRLIMNANRAVPELIFALIFVAAVGLGPFTGVLALGIAAVGSLGRLFSEAIEQIDPAQVQAVRATGASSLQIFNFAVLPQVLPLVASYSAAYFEHNVRAATVLGIVGAGGVGLALSKYIGLFQFRELMGAVIVLILAVTLLDRVSARVRATLI